MLSVDWRLSKEEHLNTEKSFFKFLCFSFQKMTFEIILQVCMKKEKWESGVGGTMKKKRRERITLEFTL